MTPNERGGEGGSEPEVFRRRVLAAIGGTTALALAGCGGNGTDDPTATAEQSRTEAGTPAGEMDTSTDETATASDGETEESSDEPEETTSNDSPEPTETEGAAAIDPAYDGWSMFALDLANTGHAPDASAPAGDIGEQWDFRTDVRFDSSPAVVDGVVYVGGNDGFLYALNAASGDKLWSFEAEDSVEASPTVTNGVVYITSDAYVVSALNAETGDQQWSFDLAESVGDVSPVGKPPSPVVADGTLFVGNPLPNTVTLHALDAETGDKQWDFAPVEAGAIGNETYGAMARTSPAVADGIVFVGDHDNPGHLYALDAETGDVQWDHSEILVNSEPTVANGLVYVGTDPSAPGHEGGVVAFDVSTGDEEWTFDIGDAVWSSPAATDDMVYFGSGSPPRASTTSVYAVDASDGSEQWSYEAGDGLVSSPAVADGTVYVGSDDHSVYALDAASGEAVWTHEIAGSLADAHIRSSPAVANGTVFVGSEGTFALTD